jgi:hypothetical protein
MGGILALVLAFGIVFGARKLCDLIGAPLWFAKFLFIGAALTATSFLAEAMVPHSKYPWGVWVAMLGAASGIIPVGFIMFKHLEEEDDSPRKPSDDQQG